MIKKKTIIDGKIFEVETEIKRVFETGIEAEVIMTQREISSAEVKTQLAQIQLTLEFIKDKLK